MTTNNTVFTAAGVAREVVIQPSTAIAVAETNQFDLYYIPPGIQSLIVVINVTAVTSTPSVVIDIQGLDGGSGGTWEILQSAAITATGMTVLRVCSHLTAATNTIAKDIVPPRVRIQATHANANSITYSMSAELCY
jgi:hypothetical protein